MIFYPLSISILPSLYEDKNVSRSYRTWLPSNLIAKNILERIFKRLIHFEEEKENKPEKHDERERDGKFIKPFDVT